MYFSPNKPLGPVEPNGPGKCHKFNAVQVVQPVQATTNKFEIHDAVGISVVSGIVASGVSIRACEDWAQISLPGNGSTTRYLHQLKCTGPFAKS